MRRTLPAVLRAATALSLLSALACGGGSGDGEKGLTPARNLAGTWETTGPVPIRVATDFCTATPTLVGTESWTATWTVTHRSESEVDIEMRYQRSGWSVAQSCGGTGYVPEPSPMFLKGTIGSAALTVRSGTTMFGEFDFTTDTMTGTLDYQWCIAFCNRLSSEPARFILRRR